MANFHVRVTTFGWTVERRVADMPPEPYCHFRNEEDARETAEAMNKAEEREAANRRS